MSETVLFSNRERSAPGTVNEHIIVDREMLFIRRICLESNSVGLGKRAVSVSETSLDMSARGVLT